MNAQSIIPPNIDYGKISADKYSPDDTYKAGELRIQYNSLWKAKQAISVPEPWTPDHWDPTTLAAEFSALNSSRALVTIDMSSAQINTDFPVPYPEGFNRGNCCVIGVSGLDKTYSVWYGYMNTDTINIVLATNIIINTSSSAYVGEGAKVKVLLEKIEP